ncbi:MAG TPA: hypothetical protein VK923_07010 [Euzebyales bacterium]|nr:hypothetical protein [Euzebyales bacterium]
MTARRAGGTCVGRVVEADALDGKQLRAVVGDQRLRANAAGIGSAGSGGRVVGLLPRLQSSERQLLRA